MLWCKEGNQSEIIEIAGSRRRRAEKKERKRREKRRKRRKRERERERDTSIRGFLIFEKSIIPVYKHNLKL